MSSYRKMLAFDAVILAAFAVADAPAITGYGFHEWWGVVLLLLFVLHMAQHVDGVRDAMRKGAKPTLARHGNLVLDVLLLAAFAATTVSGLMVSGTVLPAFGVYAHGYFLWDPLHAIAAKILLALLLLHLLAHAKWLLAGIREARNPKR